MDNPFIGEIRVFSFTGPQPPKGWILCDGRSFSVSDKEMQALFSLIGYDFGGDGRTTFRLPNFQSATAIGSGPYAATTNDPKNPIEKYDYRLGESGGHTESNIGLQQLPAHSHTLNAAFSRNSIAELENKANNYGSSYISNLVARTGFGSGLPSYAYSGTTKPADMVPLHEQSVTPTGKSEPHSNMQPYLTLAYFVCYEGDYPPRG